MRKFIALFLVISFLGMNCATYERGKGLNLSPDQKPGVKLIIQKTNGQQVRGELIAVKQNSLLIKESSTEADISVEIRKIEVIKIVRRPKYIGAGVLGFLVGAAIGLKIDASSASFNEMGNRALLGALIGVPLGIGIVKIIAGKDKKIQIEGKSKEEIDQILADLSKKARVPNFQ